MSEAADIVEFLQAMGESEMAHEVTAMHNRLEAFANGLDRDCLEAQRRAFDEMADRCDALLDAARAAEAIFARQKWREDSTDPEAVALRMLRAAILKATGEQSK